MPISNNKTTVLYSFILNSQSSADIVVGYMAGLDSSFLRGSPCLQCYALQLYVCQRKGRADCDERMKIKGDNFHLNSMSYFSLPY